MDQNSIKHLLASVINDEACKDPEYERIFQKIQMNGISETTEDERMFVIKTLMPILIKVSENFGSLETATDILREFFKS